MVVDDESETVTSALAHEILEPIALRDASIRCSPIVSFVIRFEERLKDLACRFKIVARIADQVCEYVRHIFGRDLGAGDFSLEGGLRRHVAHRWSRDHRPKFVRVRQFSSRERGRSMNILSVFLNPRVLLVGCQRYGINQSGCNAERSQTLLMASFSSRCASSEYGPALTLVAMLCASVVRRHGEAKGS